MYRREIWLIVNLAHYFQSAFTREQVYQFLRVPVTRSEFERAVDYLVEQGRIKERRGRLYGKDIERISQLKAHWSRQLFRKHRRYLKLLSGFPWVKYMGLTGSNAFESCGKNDDIDLFMVIHRNRLWLCYLLIVLFSKLLRRRNILCVNYLVDDKNLTIAHQDFYSAVQLAYMIPLFESDLNQGILQKNKWVWKFLPNAHPRLRILTFYLLRWNSSNGNGRLKTNFNGRGTVSSIAERFWSALNGFIYRNYARRLFRKFPGAFGQGIVLSEGIAKLNQRDYRNLYDQIFPKLKEETFYENFD